MSPVEDRDLRARLAGAFAVPLDAALANYAKLVETLDAHDPNDPRGDAARHGACRAALQHVVMLLKLADLSTAPAEAGGAETDAARLLAEARRTLGPGGGGPT